MGLRRVSGALIALLLSLPIAMALPAAADEVDVSRAEAQKHAADRLVTAAVAERDRLEAELFATIQKYQAAGRELAEAEADLDRVRRRLQRTGGQITVSTERLAEGAADAYMQAVSTAGSLVWSVGNLEKAMVVDRTLELLTGNEVDTLDRLVLARHDLARLELAYTTGVERAAAARLTVEEEADQLQELFAAADADLAQAIVAARQADRLYRAALDAAAEAQAKEQQRREEEAASSTTTSRPSNPPSSSTTTTVGDPPAGGRSFRPAVERWRGLVAAYFPAARVDEALAVISCESRGDPDAYNPYSGASGLFQFIPGTWAVASARAGFAGYSPFDPEANIAAADWLTGYYESRGSPYWGAWHCQP